MDVSLSLPKGIFWSGWGDCCEIFGILFVLSIAVESHPSFGGGKKFLYVAGSTGQLWGSSLFDVVGGIKCLYEL